MKRLPWFHMHTEARTDVKLWTLTDAQFRVWFALLCYAAEQPRRGTIKDRPESLIATEVARGDVALLRNTCSALVTLHVTRVVTDCNGSVTQVEFLNFNKRNSNTSSLEQREKTRNRVANYRLRKRAASDGTEPVNGDIDEAGNAPVTLSNARLAGARLRLEERREETPPTPSFSVENGEPFVPPPGELLEPEPEIPAELKRVAALAERLFPTRDIGIKILQAAADWRLDWLEAALRSMHAQGKSDWRYLTGIYRRIVDQGGPDVPKPSKPALPPAPQYKQHIAAPDSKFARFDATLNKPKQGA